MYNRGDGQNVLTFYFFIFLNLSTVDNAVHDTGIHHKIICNKHFLTVKKIQRTSPAV